MKDRPTLNKGTKLISYSIPVLEFECTKEGQEVRNLLLHISHFLKEEKNVI